MNKVKVVVVGAIVVLVAAMAAGMALLNHLHISGQPNVPYNTFYLLNQTGPFSNYVFVLSYNNYSQIAGGATNNTMIEGLLGYLVGVNITKAIIKGDHVFLIGQTLHLNASVGQKYPIMFVNIGAPPPQRPYTIWFTYEGNWTGPLP